MNANVGNAVYAILSEYTPISDVVSTRIEPVDIPQDADRPWIVYRQVSGVSTFSLGGDSGAIDHRVQIDCYSTDYDQAVTLGDNVRLAMANIRKEHRGGCFVLSANILGMLDLPAGPEVRGSEDIIHVRSVEVQIWLGVLQL